MTWEIVLGLAELVAFVAMFVAWATKRAKTDADTAAALRELASALKEFKSQSNEAHKEMWTAIDDNTHNIREHEKWIGQHDLIHNIKEDLK